MTAGVAVLLLATFASVSVSAGLASADSRANSRVPLPAASGASSFAVDIVDGFVGLQSTQIVRVAQVANAQAPPPPPGCMTFPEPGTACLSPAFSALLDVAPELATTLGAVPTQEIADVGLTNPDELIAYVRTDLATATSGSADRWGKRNGTAPPLVSTTFTSVILIVLVGLPGLVFLTVCARLSAASRARRTRTLRLLGADVVTIRATVAADGWIAGVGGTALATIAWYGGGPLFARSGIAGFRWFGEDTRVPVWVTAALFVVVPSLVGRVAQAGLARTLASAAVDRDPRPASAARLWALWVGAIAIAVYFLRSQQESLPPAWLFLIATGSVAAGVLLAGRPLTEALASWRAPVARGPAARLGWRRLQYDSSTTLRMLGGLAVLVLVATIGTAVGRDVFLAVTPSGSTIPISVDTRAQDSAGARAQVAALPGSSRLAVAAMTIGETLRDDSSNIATAVFLTCADLSERTDRNVTPCVDGQSYRIEDAAEGFFSSLQPGQHLTDSSGANILIVPEAVLDIGSTGIALAGLNGVLIATAEPLLWPARTLFRFSVSNTDAALLDFQKRVAAIDPSLVAAPDIDVDGQRVYIAITGILRTGLILGLILGLGAFVVAALDRAVERQREVAHLTAIGARAHTLRSAQARQLMVGAAVTLIPAALAGQLIGQAYLALSGLYAGWYWPSLEVGIGLALVGCLVATIPALALYGRRTDYAHFAAP